MAPAKRLDHKVAQHKAFKETARALECDESAPAFDKALKKIGKAKPAGKKSA